MDDAIEELTGATDRLLGNAGRLSDADVAAPSLLPAWTRGHVLTHLARNADGMVNLVTWARTGVETPMYADDATRAADIEAGSGRPIGELLDDLAASSERFARAFAELPADRYGVVVRLRSGRTMRARDFPWGRLREVEIHSVDLGAGYTPADWSPSFVARLLPEVVASFEGRDGVPALQLEATDSNREFRLGTPPAARTVQGHERQLLAWLLGRGPAPAPDLPPLPPWA